MKKILITGITGFAGSHLAEYLRKKDDSTIIGTHVSDNGLQNIAGIHDHIKLIKVNLHDAERVNEIINEERPDIVYHLAASTSVNESFQNPLEIIMNNVAAEINVLEALRKNELLDTKILITSSAHVYGNVPQEEQPISESAPFRPDNPYSISKVTQDLLGYQYYVSYKLQIIRVRPFNHIGPRLSPVMAVPKFAKLIAEIEKGKQEPVIKVGNLAPKRDFTDVHDMVRAYDLAIEKCANGEAYNIGSGVSHPMQEILDKLLALSNVSIKVEVDQSLFRPSDIMDLRCDATKFKNITGWEPEIPLEKMLEETIDYWRNFV
jgi:GDP-4-dehydro-6-deoxy-D-mannose reductase